MSVDMAELSKVTVTSRPAPGTTMGRALRAEWTKLRTSPGTLGLLLAVVAGTTGLSATVAAACSGGTCGADVALTGVQLGQAVVAILAVLAIGNEYSTGMFTVTLTAMPRRLPVLVGKAVVVAAVVAAAAVVAVAGSVVAGEILLPAYHATFRPAAGSVLYLVLIALLSLGLATAVRSPAAAIGTVLTMLYAVPIIVSVVTDPVWHDRFEKYSPVSAGLAVQATGPDPLIGPWQGLGVLALWTLAALLAGAILLKRRDA
ncbi:ABC transporter permease subunit [Actinoplanes regularis]|uniref:ABC transporter permease subunit n=1 Tax=Actinoplanes regularis TaxID=52697 RepID=UPI0024A13AC1|nr:ABC transporter permease subunit [Actinoplanes regularis]GLW31191.1 ABC transporter [Actinoplanes regularis]